VLTSANQLEGAFSQSLEKYNHVSFAVAWASYDFPGYKQLVGKRHKIARGIVGIHFYQTHPMFIRKFMKDERVTFIKQPAGTFHPKFYLFYNSEKDWSCLLGSANFTGPAFKKNTEVCVQFDASDDGNKALRRALDETLKRYWKFGKEFTSTQLDDYTESWRRFRRQRKALIGKFGDKDFKPVPKTSVLGDSWSDYLQRVLRDKRHNERIRVLAEAHRLFKKHATFAQMPPRDRKRIAGFAPKEEIDWALFGGMVGNRRFMQRVNKNDNFLSRALDGIPLRGRVAREQYMAYIETYKKAFQDGKRRGLATATRLLAMKRPDFFVCYDSANKRKLCKDFGIVLYGHDYEGYWDSVIKPMLDSNWWKSARPKRAKALQVWLGRAAFLDSLYYER
jgi:hypothetical protein